MRRLMSALCPTTTLKMEPPSAQSPFARCWHYLHQGDVDRLLRGHYSPVIALTDSFVDPTRSPRGGRERCSRRRSEKQHRLQCREREDQNPRPEMEGSSRPLQSAPVRLGKRQL